MMNLKLLNPILLLLHVHVVSKVFQKLSTELFGSETLNFIGSGYSPLEIATVRRPSDLLDIGTSDLAHLALSLITRGRDPIGIAQVGAERAS